MPTEYPPLPKPDCPNIWGGTYSKDMVRGLLTTERARIEREVMPLVGKLCVDNAFKDAESAAANVVAILRAIRGEVSP